MFEDRASHETRDLNMVLNFVFLLSSCADHSGLLFIEKKAVLSQVSTSGAQPWAEVGGVSVGWMVQGGRDNTGLPVRPRLPSCTFQCIMEPF